MPYTCDIAHDGRTYTVHVPMLEAPRCRNCGAIVLDDAANEQIDQAFYRAVNLP